MADYQPDYRGTAAGLRTAEMRAVMGAKAAEGMAYAKSISPDAPPYGVGYISSFEVEVGTARIDGAERATATLSNTSDHTVVVEWGAPREGRRGEHVLSRTIDFLEHG